MFQREKRYGGADAFADMGAFRQQVRLAAAQVAGLSESELQSALAFEVEPFSGIPASEAEVAYRLVPAEDVTVRVYDVAVRRRAAKRANRLNRVLLSAYLFAAFVFLFLAFDGYRLVQRRATLRREISVRRPLQDELDRLSARTRVLESDCAALQSARAASLRAQNFVDGQRKASADLLDAFATACGERSVITSITPGEMAGRHAVGGVSVSCEAAAETLRELTEVAACRHWRIIPGAIVSSPSGATATFSATAVWSAENP